MALLGCGEPEREFGQESARILPDGDKLDDFVGWLTDDHEEGLLQKDWRPTRLRFGTVEWRGDHGWLQLTVGEERPFVPRFIEEKAPTKGMRKKAFPRDQRELCLATAWRLIEDGQSVLIFCPLRRSVEPFAEAIVDLHTRGLLPSVLDTDEDVLAAPLTIGAEWFDEDHPILACLKLGVAVHHGALPTPYRREVERLLRQGVLKITVSSPTLAQGLNLSATALVFHSLHRNRQLIEISEFRNVIGRAGRAFVDLEGLVLFPMFGDLDRKKANWQALIEDTGGKEMESGLYRLVQYLLARMIKKHNPGTIDAFREYVVNAAYWDFPEIEGEDEDAASEARSVWPLYVSMLDTAILGLIGENDIDEDGIEDALDAILQSSLWTRRLAHREQNIRDTLTAGLVGRAKYIWSQSNAVQRRAYFLAGVGLETGRQLDAQAEALIDQLIKANGAILAGEQDKAIAAFIAMAEISFAIPLFAPKRVPDDWKAIISVWLKGEPISSLDGCDDPETLKFIEDALIYRLPWGMEATRVRALAHGMVVGDGLTLEDFELGLAVLAIETGTLNVPAALLMKAGFASRSAAIAVVEETGAAFTSLAELRDWIRTDPIKALSEQEAWPTAETSALWREFVASLRGGQGRAWKKSAATVHVTWDADVLQPGAQVRLFEQDGAVRVATPRYENLGRVDEALSGLGVSLIAATVAADNRKLDLLAFGPTPIRPDN